MAELILGSVVDSITGQIVSLVSKEIGLARDVKTELEKLQLTVSSISSFLCEVEKRHVEAEDVNNWLKDLKDVVYDADDLLDDFATEVMRRQGLSGRGKRILNEVRIFFSSSNQLFYAGRMAHRVKDIKEMIDVINRNRSIYRVEGDSCPLGNLVQNKVRPDSNPFEIERFVVGREKDKEEVMRFLLNPDFEDNVSILPIVGVGGLGKTTLARLIFNDESVKEYFELKVWVCVSTNFDVEDILRKIIGECSARKDPAKLNMNELQDELREKLYAKKFLLVLDDVWNDNELEWLRLEGFLMNSVKGSKVLVTTREPRVAKTMARSYHELSGLVEGESVSLLMRMARKEEEEWKNHKLETIAKEIVKKCVGVPLAITTIGRLLLHIGNTEEDWLNFQKYDLLRIDQKEGDILPSLKLSYDFLPSHLKQCFAYCSLFPKDFQLNPSELISLWIAHGFVKPSGNRKALEEVGWDYFMELVSRSFFQEIEKSVYGSIRRCKMHDLMHDLAQRVAGNNCTTIDSPNVNEFPKASRHVSLVVSKEFDIKKFEMNQRIRSLLLTDGDYCRNISHLDISRFGNLRALRLRETFIEVISSSIGKLKHLRSLDLSRNYFLVSLPNSISRLCNLEALNLKNCYDLENLPRGITKLINLRHLDVRGCSDLKYMPRGIGKMTSLQTLPAFAVGEKENSNAARLNEFVRFGLLMKKLEIQHMERLGTNSSEVDASFTVEKFELLSLKLVWDSEEEHRTNTEDVLERFRPHRDLKGFKIEGYSGARLSSWFCQLHNLVDLNISLCHKLMHLPPLDQFPSLKKITLVGLGNLEWIELSERDTLKQSLFASLKVLKMRHLPKFKGWRRRAMDDNEVEGEEDIHEDVEDDSLLVFPSFSDKIELSIEYCPSFSFMQGQQALHLGWITDKVLHQLLRNSTQSPGAMPTPSTITFNSMSSISPFTSELTSLTLEGLEDIEILPVEFFQSLKSLRSLKIDSCNRLKSLSGWAILQYLPVLEKLSIWHCPELDLSIEDDGDESGKEVQFPGHKKLEWLAFIQIVKTETVPRWVQHLVNLKDLTILSCENMKCLPEWFPKLTSLKSLLVSNCGELTRRCERSTGEDWPKISHISEVVNEYF